MRRVFWWRRLAPAVLVALAVAGGSACHGRPAARPATAVRVETLAARSGDGVRRYSGTARALTQVELAFRLGGYVESIGPGPAVPDAASRARVPGTKPRVLQAGDPVKEGMMLASLRKKDFQQRYREISSMNAEASAGLGKAKADYARAQKLFDRAVISPADLEAARARYQALAGATGSSSARVGEAGLALSDAELRAPFDGIVLERRVEVGELMAAGAPAFVVADTTQMKIVFGVPDHVQAALREGQNVRVTTDALDGRVYLAAITKVGAHADPATRAFDIEATLDNGDGSLKVGMVTSVELGAGPQDGAGLLLPLSAVVRAPGAPGHFAVFVLTPAQTVRARLVELGQLVGNRVSVLSGVAAGEVIVTQGSTLLFDGDAVNVVPGVPVDEALNPRVGESTLPGARGPGHP